MVLHYALRQTGRSCAFRMLCLAVFLSLPLTGFASVKKLTLTWDSPAGTDIAGYRLHYGTNPGSYSHHADVGMTTVYTVDGLEKGNYFFVLTAYNRSGQESGFSNEVEYYLPAPPTITGISDTSGPAGMEISISGENLVKETIVSFNGIRAPIILLTSNKAVVAVPAGFSSGPITVTTPGGSAVTPYFTVTPPQSRTAITVPGGGSADYGTIGPSNELEAGYAIAETEIGKSFFALSFLSHSQEGAVSSAVSLPASTATRSTTVAVEHRLRVPSGTGLLDIKTGLSIVNCGSEMVSLQLTLRDNQGNSLQARVLNLSGGDHTAEFLDQLFEMPDGFGLGTLNVRSDQPVSILALRLTLNESGRLLLSSAPAVDMSEPAASGPLYFTRMAVGAGYHTRVVLFNTSDREQTGEIHLLTQSGTLINGAHGSDRLTTSPYVIRPGGVYGLTTTAGDLLIPGWVKVVPDEGTGTPAGGLIIGYANDDGILSAESSFPSVQPVKHALLTVDESTGIETSVAFVNPGPVPSRIDVNAIQANQELGTGASVDLAANESAGGYVQQLFRNSLPDGFKGVVEITSTQPFLAAGLQSFINSRGDFVFTNVPILDPSRTAPFTAVFPQVADGAGYQTRFVFLNPGQSEVPVELKFFSDGRQPIAVGR